MRKIRRHLFADKSARQICNLQAALDRIVIGDRDVIHPMPNQLLIQRLWIRVAVGKIETTEEPFFRARAVAGVNM